MVRLQDKWLQFLCNAFIVESVCFLALLVLIFLMNGCAVAPSASDIDASTNAQKTIFHNLKLDVNGEAFVGTDVLPNAVHYAITVYPTNAIERIVWTSCHQQKIVEKPDTGWWNHSYAFDFRPISGMEDSSSCALEIAIVEHDAFVDLALMEFKDRREEVSLPAKMQCNGSTWPTSGVSICQAAHGLRQKITFQEPVVVPSNENTACDVMKSVDEKVYTYNIAPGECHYYFTAQTKSKNGKRLLFRLTTLGYTDVPRRAE